MFDLQKPEEHLNTPSTSETSSGFILWGSSASRNIQKTSPQPAWLQQDNTDRQTLGWWRRVVFRNISRFKNKLRWQTSRCFCCFNIGNKPVTSGPQLGLCFSSNPLLPANHSRTQRADCPWTQVNDGPHMFSFTHPHIWIETHMQQVPRPTRFWFYCCWLQLILYNSIKSADYYFLNYFDISNRLSCISENSEE